MVEDRGAAGILLGTFGTGVIFLAWRLWQERRRLSFVPDRPLLRRMLRFGLPTMPAELTLYSLSFIDRILIVRLAGLAEAGLYALAIKFAQGINVLARGFQLAFPPLAYSIVDDDEARRAYSLVFTWFAAVLAFSVAGLWLFSRWIVDLLAAAEFFAAYEAIGLLATGTALYALYLVLVVILGRTGRTEFSLPATAAGAVVNIGLNLVLIGPLGIVGAGIALIASYLVVLGAMFVLTQRLFPVAYEWGRLGLLIALTAATVAAGELLLPTEGLAGFALRGLRLACASGAALGGWLSDAGRARGSAHDARPERGTRAPQLAGLCGLPAGARAGNASRLRPGGLRAGRPRRGPDVTTPTLIVVEPRRAPAPPPFVLPDAVRHAPRRSRARRDSATARPRHASAPRPARRHRSGRPAPRPRG